MSSIKLHKYEKWFYRFLFSFAFLFIVTGILFFINNETTLYVVVSSVMKVFLVLSIGMNLFISKKTKDWRERGSALTKEIGLKRLLLVEGQIPNRKGILVLEIHHNLGPIKDGFKYKKESREKIISDLKEELNEDFRKLAEWKNHVVTENLLLVTTTHIALAKIWERSSHPCFYVRKSDKLFDPYVKMNRLEWMAASFSTTGRISYQPPKQWNSYYFYTSDKMGA